MMRRSTQIENTTLVDQLHPKIEGRLFNAVLHFVALSGPSNAPPNDGFAGCNPGLDRRGRQKGPDFLASGENPAIYRAISHGNMAQKAVRWQPGRKGPSAHTFPEEPTGELTSWRYPIFLCVSCLKLACTLVTNRTAGIRKCRISFLVPATTSTSSTSRRPCRCCISRCRPSATP